jgi:hypothetical protein
MLDFGVYCETTRLDCAIDTEVLVYRRLSVKQRVDVNFTDTFWTVSNSD